MDANSEQGYYGRLPDLIALHARKRNLPNFFENLLHLWGKCIDENPIDLLEGQILPIINSMAIHAEELNFAQAIQLFDIFSEKYCVFLSMSESHAVGKVVFILAQLFSTFLLHVKLFEPSLPSRIYEKYGKLIQLTINKLKNNSHVLLDRNQVLLQRAHLLLCSVVGKTKLAYDKNSSILLLEFLTKHAELLEVLLNGEDKVLSFLALQLLILKVEGLKHNKELSEAEVVQLKTTTSIIVQHAGENIHAGDSWDLDLNTLSRNNYATAVWRQLLGFLPLVLDSIHKKELFKICECFREILIKKDFLLNSDVEETDLQSIVLLYLHSPHFQESRYFQRTLISSLWNLDSCLLSRKRFSDEQESEHTLIQILTYLSSIKRKWQKYDESPPKSLKCEELNPLWSSLKEICSYLNEILLHNSRAKLEIKTFNILQLIDCLPLRYLQPGSQLKCIIGLSTLFFLVPDSCPSAKCLIIAEKIAGQLITIIDGERSIWLFDFVKSGPYLKKMMNTIEELVERERLTDAPDSLKLLMKHLINLVTKNSKVLSEAQEYFSEGDNLNQQLQLTICSKVNEEQHSLHQGYLSEEEKYNIFSKCLTLNSLHTASDLPAFIKSFDEVFKSINHLMVYYSEFVIKTAAVFMRIVTMLLDSLVAAGAQDLVLGSTKDVQEGMFLCSRNMARLLSMIAKKKKDFSKLIPFLVGDFSNSVAQQTLEKKIKGILIASINELIKTCSSYTLKMVCATLHVNCREIFSKIIKESHHTKIYF